MWLMSRVVAWFLRACQRAAVGCGLVWVRGRRRSCARRLAGEVFHTGCPLDETPWSVDVLLIDCTGPSGPRPMCRLRRPLLPVTS